MLFVSSKSVYRFSSYYSCGKIVPVETGEIPRYNMNGVRACAAESGPFDSYLIVCTSKTFPHCKNVHINMHNKNNCKSSVPSPQIASNSLITISQITPLKCSARHPEPGWPPPEQSRSPHHLAPPSPHPTGNPEHDLEQLS